MNQKDKLDSIRVAALDPDNPSKQPSEMVTITCEREGLKYQISIHSAESVDDLIAHLANAKQEAWND